MKPKLKPPGTKRLKLKCDILLSTSAFEFNLRRYSSLSKLIMLSQLIRAAATATTSAGAHTRSRFSSTLSSSVHRITQLNS